MRLALVRILSGGRVCLTIFVVLALSTFVSANTVTVGCAGAAPGAYDYATVNLALNALSSNSLYPNTIIISGTCHENIEIHGWRYLTLAGTPSAKLTAPPYDGIHSDITLYVTDSLAFSLTNITVEGPDDLGRFAFWALHSSGNVLSATFENAVGGMVFSDLSDFHLTSVLVQDNQDTGVSVSHSHISFDNTESVEPVSSTIQRNSLGIDADQNSSVALWGGTTVQNNDFAGISMESSNLTTCCEPGIRKIVNNGFGVRLLDGSTATLRGVDIENNSVVGLQLIGSSAELLSSHTVSNNSVAGLGILMRSSHLELRNGHVDSNGAMGIVARESSSLRMQNETVSGNGTGVQALLLSSVGVIGGSIVGNGTDLVCSPESMAFGDKPVIGTLKCPSFGVDPLPGTGTN